MRPRFKALVVALGGAAWGCAGPTPIPAAQLADPGALIFNGYGDTHAQCYHCHAPDGAGGFRGPDLKWLVPRVGNARIWDQIENGDAVMPAYKDQLSEREITEVVRWMRVGFPVARPRVAQGPQGRAGFRIGRH